MTSNTAMVLEVVNILDWVGEEMRILFIRCLEAVPYFITFPYAIICLLWLQLHHLPQVLGGDKILIRLLTNFIEPLFQVEGIGIRLCIIT